MMESVEDFMSLTSCASCEEAHMWLEAASYDFEVAVNMFFTAGGGTVNNLKDGAPPSIPPNSHSTEAVIRAPDHSIKMVMQPEDTVVGHRKRAAPPAPSVFAVSGTFRPKTSTECTLADLFKRPTKLMFPGNFQELRLAGKDEDKWLLVNVQSEEEFSCHALNRDVWSDECIIDIIGCAFIFWQQQNSVGEGVVYIERYKVVEFPHIGIVDPRTGALVWNKEGCADKELISQYLQDFVMDHPNPSTWKASKHSRGATSSNDSSVLEFINAPQVVDLSSQTSTTSSSSSTGSVAASIDPKDSKGFEIMECSGEYNGDGLSNETGEVTKLLLRMPNGAKLEHIVDKRCPTQKIVHIVSSMLYASGLTGRFDLIYGFPPASLSEAISKHLDQRKKLASGDSSLTR
jgi:hypothetical protein